MTGTITPTAAPAAPAAATSASPADAVDADRRAPFGPALARAREQGGRAATEHESESTEEPTTKPESSEPSTPTGDEPVPSSPLGDTETVQGQGGDDTAPSPTESQTASSSAPTTAALTIELPETSAATPAIGDPAASDHPTAKGAAGEGGPSTTPTVEEAAPPARSSEEPTPMTARAISTGTGASAAAGGQAGDGTTAAPIDAALAAEAGAATNATRNDGAAPVVTSGAGDGARPASESAGRGEGDAVRTATERPAGRTDLPAAPSVTTAGPDRPAGPGSASAAPTSDALPPVDNTTAAVDEAGLAATRSAPDDASAGVTPRGSASADGPEGLVVLAREAVRSADATRPAVASSPTPGPLNPAEGSLWEDVRLAFGRIRDTGDGQEVRIRLRPAELGELVVQVRTQGEQVAVRLTTSSTAAQQALVDDRLRLAAELARAGFEEGSVDIGRDDGGGLGQPRQGTDGDRGRGRVVPEPIAGLVERSSLERRDPIRTESGVRPGRYAYSTINLTL